MTVVNSRCDFGEARTVDTWDYSPDCEDIPGAEEAMEKTNKAANNRRTRSADGRAKDRVNR